MNSELMRKALRLTTFVAMASLSLMCTSALLNLRLGRSLAGLALIAGLLVSVLYVTAKYLLALWNLSNRFTLAILSAGSQPVPSSNPQGEEQSQ